MRPIKADANSAGGIRPVFSQDLTAATLWEHVAHAGLKAAAVGWPVSYPVTTKDENQPLVVSDVFAQAQGKTREHWPKDNASISDSDLHETLAPLRIHPNEVSAELMATFLIKAEEISQDNDERLSLLATIIARTASLHAVSSWIAEHYHSNLLSIHFDFIERISAAFLEYRVPRMRHVSANDFDHYKDIIDNAYAYFDHLLGHYLTLIDNQCHIMLASDHGYLTENLRNYSEKKGGERVAKNYREVGIFCVAGPGIKQDELVSGTTQLDITPTALALLGLAIPTSLAGRVEQNIFETAVKVDNTNDLDVDRSHLSMPNDEHSTQQVFELITAGYIAQPAKEAERAYVQTQVDWFSTLAQTLMAKLDYENAIVAL